jgi:sorting nexin-41/42
MTDYAQDHMELGAIWNGFSLNESGELAASIEKTGQAIDTTYVSTTRLVRVEPTSLVESTTHWGNSV